MNDYPGVAWQVTAEDGTPLFHYDYAPGPPVPIRYPIRIDMYRDNFSLEGRAYWKVDYRLHIKRDLAEPNMHPRPRGTVDMGVVNDLETAKSIMHAWYSLTDKGKR